MKRIGVISGRERQIDALIQGTVGGESIEIAIECKHYTKSVGIGVVDELHGKLLDLGVERGVLYSFGPISAGAEARGKGIVQAPKIRCQRFNPASIASYRWERVAAGLFGFGNGGNPNCITGDVSWHVWPAEDGKDPVIEAPAMPVELGTGIARIARRPTRSTVRRCSATRAALSGRSTTTSSRSRVSTR